MFIDWQDEEQGFYFKTGYYIIIKRPLLKNVLVYLFMFQCFGVSPHYCKNNSFLSGTKIYIKHNFYKSTNSILRLSFVDKSSILK